MASPDLRSIDIPIEVFGGKVSQFSPDKLPLGASPFNRDVVFSGQDPSGIGLVAGVATRPGLARLYPSFLGNPSVNYLRTFVDSVENLRQLILDGLGNLRQEFPQGALSIVGTVVAASFCQSDTYAGREWLAISDSQFGIDIPRQWDGTNFDRVSSVGPGTAPNAVDSAVAGNISAGLHQVSVCFLYRSGYITCPAPPTSWTAAGSKKVSLTNIPTGPPDVLARILIFTPVITSPATSGPFFYFSAQLTAGSATFPSMIITDNVTTTATFDFLDAVLQNATAATNLFNQIELGECSSNVSYSERMFWAGERNKVNSAGGGGGFNNLTFDGGFGSIPVPANTAANPPTAAVSSTPQVPSTLLNGWGPNGHVGSYEGGVDQGFAFGLDPSTTQPYNNPGNAFDGNPATFASAIGQHTHTYYGCVWSFAGAVPKPSMVLNITSEVLANGEGGFSITTRSAGIWVSLDGGLTWPINPYNQGTRAKQTDSIPLPAGQDPTKVQVMAFTDSHDDMVQYVYEINISQPGVIVGGAAWNNPTNIELNDGNSTTANLTASGTGATSQSLLATGFGFAVPANAQIVGVVATIKAMGSNFGQVQDQAISLIKGGAVAGANQANGNLWTGGFVNRAYGNPSDSWGLSLAPADVNAANFGISIQVVNSSSAAAVIASIDFVTLQVFYTTAATGTGPLGWTQTANFAGGNSALSTGNQAYWGDAYAIVGDGVSPIRGQITQTAFQDYLQVPILSPNVSYSVRARIAAGTVPPTGGVLQINLQSASGGFTTVGLNVFFNQLSGQYVEFIGLLTPPLSAIPNDLILQTYVFGAFTGTFLVDCVEVFPTNNPINRTTVRVSYSGNPEGFDSLTGLMIVGKNNGQSVRSMFRLLDNKIYVVKERSMYVTQDDNANEPASWVITTVSDTVGTYSNHGVAVAEDWAVIASRDGLYIFFGSGPIKISQEIQPDWNSINWAAAQKMYVVVDTFNRRIHVGAPTGTSTIPNTEFVMDYSQLNGAQDIADHPQAYYSIYNATKVIAPGRARKWTVWNLLNGAGINSAAITMRNDGSFHMTRGNAAGDGNVYDQQVGQFSDNGLAINSVYQTYFFPEAEQEQILQLGSHRKLVKYLTGYTVGKGFQTWAITGPNGQRQQTLSNIVLQNPPLWDFEKNVNFVGERASLIFGTNAVGSWFHLSKLIPVIQKELLTPVRGTA